MLTRCKNERKQETYKDLISSLEQHKILKLDEQLKSQTQELDKHIYRIAELKASK